MLMIRQNNINRLMCLVCKTKIMKKIKVLVPGIKQRFTEIIYFKKG